MSPFFSIFGINLNGLWNFRGIWLGFSVSIFLYKNEKKNDEEFLSLMLRIHRKSLNSCEIGYTTRRHALASSYSFIGDLSSISGAIAVGNFPSLFGRFSYESLYKKALISPRTVASHEINLIFRKSVCQTYCKIQILNVSNIHWLFFLFVAQIYGNLMEYFHQSNILNSKPYSISIIFA